MYSRALRFATILSALVAAAAPTACGDDAAGPSVNGEAGVPDSSGPVTTDASNPTDAAPPPSDAEARTSTKGRLFVFSEELVDGGKAGTAYEILDLDNGTSLPDLTPTPNGVSPSEDRRIGLVNRSFEAQGPGLALLDPGLAMDMSSNPAKVVAKPPSLGPLVPALRVRNTVVSADWIGTFSESDSVARFFGGTAAKPKVVTVNDNGGLSSDYEVSGLAFAFAGDFYASVVSVGAPAFPGGPRPTGFRRYNASGTMTGELGKCGDALVPGVNDEYAVIGCGDGLQVLRKKNGVFSERKVPYASDTVFVVFVRGTPGSPFFVLGGLNTDTFENVDLSIFDPRVEADGGADAGSSTVTLPGTADLRVYDLVPKVNVLVGLTAGGVLRVYDLVTKAVRTVALPTQPVAAPDSDRLPFPSVPGPVVYVTSPGTKQIFEVDTRTNPPTVIRTLKTRNFPTGIPDVLGVYP